MKIDEIRKQAQKMLEDVWTDRAPELWEDYKADLDYYILKAYEEGKLARGAGSRYRGRR